MSSAIVDWQEQARVERDRAVEAELQMLRMRVALRLGLTEDHAKRLRGNTEHEIEADAHKLFATPAPETLSQDLQRRVRREPPIRIVPSQTERPPLRSAYVPSMGLNTDALLQSLQRKLGIGSRFRL